MFDLSQFNEYREDNRQNEGFVEKLREQFSVKG